MDSTSLDVAVPDFTKALRSDVKGLRIGLPKEYFGEGIDPEVKAEIMKAVKKYEELGAEIVEVSLPHTEYAVITYYIIAPAEASANLARYDGVRYGYRNLNATSAPEMTTMSRTEGFGLEVRRRIMLGTYVLSSGYYDAYYNKAMQVRTLIRRDFEAAFEKCDVLLTPTSPVPAYKIDGKMDPLTIKKFTTEIEDATPLGRLFDMDVIRPDGRKVDREELNLEGRRCLICGGPAKVCSSRRIHTVAELQEKTTEILTAARDAQDIADAARLAVRALLYEVTTTPKPGLVDEANNGAHRDMDVPLFERSAHALRPCFEEFVRLGIQGALPAALQQAGVRAEQAMFAATGGVNTHKGAIYSGAPS